MAKILQITAVTLLLLQSYVQARTQIDVRSDIPVNGNWTFDCALGYAEDPTDFNCYNGGVSLPPGNSKGFWTKCEGRCRITYNVQPNDKRYTVRLYQSNIETEVIYDSERSEFIRGNGWVYLSLDLTGKRQIAIALDHLAPEFFTLMDLVIVE